MLGKIAFELHELEAKELLTIWRKFRSDAKGATAIEFGLIAAPLLASFLMIIEMGMGFLAAAQLDLAAYRASEAVRLGTNAGLDADKLKKEIICPNLRGLNCDKLGVQIDAVPTFNAAPAPTLGVSSFNTGGSRSLVAIQLTYPFPVFTNYLTGPVVNYDGKNVLLLTGSLATIKAF